MDKINLLLTFFLISFVISLWIIKPTFVNDSYTYAGVARNYVEQGKLNYNLNWPELQMDEKLSEFTDFAPGLVFLTIPFQYIFNDIVFTSIFLQSILILLYCITIYFLLKKLKIDIYTTSLGIILLILFPYNFKILRYFLTETPYIISSLLFLYFSINYFKNKGKHNLIYLLLFAFLSSSFKYLGVFNFISFGIIFLIEKRKNYRDLLLIGFFAGLPVILWFLRNYFLIDEISSSHNFGNFIGLKLFFKYEIKSIFEIGFIIFIISLFSFLLLFYMPLLKYNNIKNDKEYKIIYIFGLISLIGLFAISMVSKFDSIGGRFLAQPLNYFIVLLVIILNNLKLNYKITLVFATLIPLLYINFYLWKKDNNLIINDKELWKSLNSNNYYNFHSSHFFTMEFNNQELYTKLPIRHIYNENLNQNYVDSILTLGHNPFVLMKNNNLNYNFFENMERKNKLRKFETEFGYTLFFRKEN